MEAVLESQVVSTGTHGSIPEGGRKEREERENIERERRERRDRGERRIRLKQIYVQGAQSVHFLKKNISSRITTT